MNHSQFSQNKLVLPFFCHPYLFCVGRKKPRGRGEKIHREDQSVARRGKNRVSRIGEGAGARLGEAGGPQVEVRLSVLALAGLHHLHGEAAPVLRLRGPPAAQGPQARAGGQAWQVRPHVPSAVPGGHVQQRQQGG